MLCQIANASSGIHSLASLHCSQFTTLIICSAFALARACASGDMALRRASNDLLSPSSGIWLLKLVFVVRLPAVCHLRSLPNSPDPCHLSLLIAVMCADLRTALSAFT